MAYCTSTSRPRTTPPRLPAGRFAAEGANADLGTMRCMSFFLMAMLLMVSAPVPVFATVKLTELSHTTKLLPRATLSPRTTEQPAGGESVQRAAPR